MKKMVWSILSIFILFFIGRLAFSLEEYKTEDEEAKAYNVTRSVKTVQGLHFRVEDDRPIEKIAGVYRPIDLDSYIALKFNKLEKKIADLNETLSKRIDELSARVDELTKNAPPQNQTAPQP
ncbi:MAG: hypothetical protein V1840_03225 [Candidatus Omnitrophota bacterium]